MNNPTLHDLNCLITWPPGSVGEAEDTLMLQQLLALCRKHGFGRVPQLAASIEEIWRDPTKVEDYEKSKAAHLRMMAEARSLES